MPTATDRAIIKAFTIGELRTASTVSPIVDVIGEVGRQNEETFTFEIPADATIAETPMALRKACRVKKVDFVGATALAASGSAFVTMLLQKRDGAGGAAVTTATLDTNTAGGNVSIAAFVPAAFVLSSTFANLVFAAGNVMTFKSTETSTPATPIGKVTVTVEYI
jgi:hypothetical protein